MDDVIKLVQSTYTYDTIGNSIATTVKRTVYCEVVSINRNEYYQAAQVDMHPELIFKLANYKDYLGEKEAEYTNWQGVTKKYDVIRAYRRTDSDEIELTVTERIGNG